MILYIENPKDYTKKLLELINKFGKVAGYKINIQKSVAFYTLVMNYQKEKLRNQSHLIYSKIMIIIVIIINKPRNKFNQGGKRPLLRKL